MSFSSFKPPKELDFQGTVAQAWKKFVSEFIIFLCATGLDEKPEKRQVMCLLNVIGECGRAVYDAMQFAAVGDNLKFAIVKKKFEEHCIPKQNELSERDRFNARTQKTGDQYVSVLRKLVESYNFGIQEDSIIRDQLVRGMLPDEKLKDKLYEEDYLNLEKAIKIITHTKQQKELMIITQVPDYPWQRVASDLFSFDGESYVLVGDYFSKFVEYTKLSHDTTSASVITFLQEQFP